MLRQSADAHALPRSSARCARRPIETSAASTPLTFAGQHGLDEERAIAAFLHAARLGLFELSWNVLCPGCGGVLEAGATLKTLNARNIVRAVRCGLRADPRRDGGGHLHRSPRMRRIAAHSPDYAVRSGILPPDFLGLGRRPAGDARGSLAEFTIETIELPPGEKAVLSVQLPNDFVIVFDPVTHGAQFIDVKGEPTRERQNAVDGVQQGQTPVGDDRAAAGAAARVARKSHRPPRAARAVDRRRRLHDCSAGAGRSSPPSVCSPTRRSATSTAPTRSTSISGSRSPA